MLFNKTFLLGIVAASLAGKAFAQQIEVNPTYFLPMVSIADSAVMYKTTIKNPKRNISGLLYIKQSDSMVWHTVLITEMGMTIFDMELSRDSAKFVELNAFLQGTRAPELIKADMQFLIHAFVYGKIAQIKQVGADRKCVFRHSKYRCKIDSQGRVLSARQGKRRIKYVYAHGNVPQSVFIQLKYTGIRWELVKTNKL